MGKLTYEEVLSTLKNMELTSGGDVSGVLVYIEELKSKTVKLEEELRKLRLAAARKTSSASSMNSRLMDALRE